MPSQTDKTTAQAYHAWLADPCDTAINTLMAAITSQALRQAADPDLAQEATLVIWQKLPTFKATHYYGMARYVAKVVSILRVRSRCLEAPFQMEEMQEIVSPEAAFISLSELSEFESIVADALLRGNTLNEAAESLKMRPSALRKKFQRSRDSRHKRSTRPDV